MILCPFMDCRLCLGGFTSCIFAAVVHIHTLHAPSPTSHYTLYTHPHLLHITHSTHTLTYFTYYTLYTHPHLLHILHTLHTPSPTSHITHSTHTLTYFTCYTLCTHPHLLHILHTLHTPSPTSHVTHSAHTLTYFTYYTLSQRSPVDELERESQTDELTVVISYLFMFAYITLFLGHIRSVATVLVSYMSLSVLSINAIYCWYTPKHLYPYHI